MDRPIIHSQQGGNETICDCPGNETTVFQLRWSVNRAIQPQSAPLHFLNCLNISADHNNIPLAREDKFLSKNPCLPANNTCKIHFNEGHKKNTC